MDDRIEIIDSNVFDHSATIDGAVIPPLRGRYGNLILRLHSNYEGEVYTYVVSKELCSNFAILFHIGRVRGVKHFRVYQEAVGMPVSLRHALILVSVMARIYDREGDATYGNFSY